MADNHTIEHLKEKISSLEAKNAKLKKVAKRLKSGFKLAKDIFATVREPLIILDADLKVLMANRSFYDTFKTSRENTQGRFLHDLGNKQWDKKALRRILKDVLTNGTSFNDFEVVHNFKHIGQRTMLLNARPVHGSTDENKLILLAIEDITKRKRLEEERENMEARRRHNLKMEAVGRLVGGVTHDFNNILTTILGNVSLAMTDLNPGTPAYEELQEIRKAGEKAAALTRQLLTFSRKDIMQPEYIVLNKAIADIDKMLKRLIREDIQLRTVFEPDIWKVYIDPGQLDQVIMNLAINARDAMPKGGNLTIETANIKLSDVYFVDRSVQPRPGNYTMLTVTDTGVGMDKKTLSRIFDPFFTTKARRMGTGLGLATVYGIVKQNNGFIWAYSEPGKGTTVKVYLPAAEEDLEQVKKQKPVEGKLTGTETILIAEDNDPLRKTAQKALKSLGYKVLEAQNGEEALNMAKNSKEPIHLLLTDLIMPKMGGEELVKQLLLEIPDIKVLYMSGYTDNTVFNFGVLKPCVNFLQKPFTPEILGRKVRETLDDLRRV